MICPLGTREVDKLGRSCRGERDASVSWWTIWEAHVWSVSSCLIANLAGAPMGWGTSCTMRINFPVGKIAGSDGTSLLRSLGVRGPHVEGTCTAWHLVASEPVRRTPRLGTVALPTL
jgi:hypothetical protein